MARFNRKWVVGNLRETVEHLESAIAEIEKGNYGACEAWTEFIYCDLNRAWNGRNLSIEPCKRNDETIRSFPREISFVDNP